jgi:hypothetical protein
MIGAGLARIGGSARRRLVVGNQGCQNDATSLTYFM